MYRAELAQSRKELLRQAAILRSPTQASAFAGIDFLPSKKCPQKHELANLLTRNEQKFWHAFLANADVFASIKQNTGPRFLEEDDPVGWADICFATADVMFDLLVDSEPSNVAASEKQVFLYKDGQKHENAWRILEDHLQNSMAVLLFELEGTSEGHKFIVYPIGNGNVLFAQSVGGIMRATLRIFTVKEFLQLLFFSLSGVGQMLFGYSIRNNFAKSLAFQFGVRRADISEHLLLDQMKGLSEKDRARLRKAFAEQYNWKNFNVNSAVDDYFRMDQRPQPWLYYFVHPITFEWQCASRAIDVPQSLVAIALQSGAVCPRKK